MSTSSSEEGSGILGHDLTSSGLESTGSLLSSGVPSDLSDVQTEITPPPSPTPSEEKTATSRDIFPSSRRLEYISGVALQGDVTPTKPKHFHRPVPVRPESTISDEAGYDADGDGDGELNEDAGILRGKGAGTTETMRPTRRPTFLRIDTRQHRRVASMLATRRPSSTFWDADTDSATPHPPRSKLSLFSRKPPAGATPAKTECYELQRRQRGEKEPRLVGLGIGFPESHPLRNRSFSMPVSAVSPTNVNTGFGRTGPHWRYEWSPSPSGFLPTAAEEQCKKKTVQFESDLHAPNPVRLALRPTLLNVSPSPLECLSGTFNRYDIVPGDQGTWPDISKLREDAGDRRVGIFGCDAKPETEIERMRDVNALLVVRHWEGQLDLSESMVLGAGPKDTAALDRSY